MGLETVDRCPPRVYHPTTSSVEGSETTSAEGEQAQKQFFHESY